MGRPVNNSDNLDKKQLLLEIATELFIAKGYGGVSIREIAKQSNLNSALIAYYFGDKEGLFIEVYKIQAKPINQKRLKTFNRFAKTNSFTLHELIKAWVEPLFHENAHTDSNISPLITLTISLDPTQTSLLEKLVIDISGEVNLKFLDLAKQCLPHLSKTTLAWRLLFMVGSILTYESPRAKIFESLSDDKIFNPSSSEIINQLVTFAAAGFEAPEVEQIP